MKFGVWRFVLENADGKKIRKVEVVSTSGKAAKAEAMISDGEEVLLMKRCTWISGFDADEVTTALNTVMTRCDAERLVEVLRHCGVFGKFYGADE